MDCLTIPYQYIKELGDAHCIVGVGGGFNLPPTNIDYNTSSIKTISFVCRVILIVSPSVRNS